MSMDHPSRPVVIVLAGMSLDGRITVGPSRSSRNFDENLNDRVSEPLRRLRAESNAVMVGINTINADDPSLKCPDNPDLLRVVIDSKCRVSLKAKVISDMTAPTIVVTTLGASQHAVRDLLAAGVEIIRCGTTKVDIMMALNALYVRGVRRLLVEGGGRLIGSLLASNLIDELRVVIFPFIVADDSAAPLVEVNNASLLFQLCLIEVTQLSDHHLLVRYAPAKAQEIK